MNQNTIAILISIISLVLSIVAIAWTIYEKLFLRPRSRVTCNIADIITPANQKNMGPFIDLTITNLGPGNITIQTIVARQGGFIRKLFGKLKQAVIVNDYTNPYNPKMPTPIGQYEKTTQLLSFNIDSFPKERFTHVGFIDTIGRCHWANRSLIKKVQSSYDNKFLPNKQKMNQ